MNTTLSKETETSQLDRKRIVRPVYNLAKSEHSYELSVNLPGCKKEDVQLKLEKNVLSVKGTRLSRFREGKNLLHREIWDTDFQLNLRVNIDLDRSQLAAKHEDGVLEVTLPIAEESKPISIDVE